MLKTKQRRFAIVAILVFSLIAMYGGMPNVNAADMDSAKVTLSDSDLSVVSTSTVVFDLGTELTAGQYVQINYEAGFNLTSATTTCPVNTTGTASGQDIFCTVDATFTLASDTPQTITIIDVTNPGTANDYSIIISSHAVGGAEIESTETKVYIIDDVTVTAHVDASLTFAVAGTATSTTINGDDTTGSTSPTQIAFETLAVDTEQLMGQILTVSTNASAGFTVTVQQAAPPFFDSFCGFSDKIVNCIVKCCG